MVGKIASQFEECVRSRKLTKLANAEELVDKELRVAKADLDAAREGLEHERFKWSTIQAYYSMFHASRALLYSEGYREKSHYCLRIALEELFVKEGELDQRFIDALQVAKMMRENADYEEKFSREGAEKLVKAAHEFIDAAEALLKRQS